MLNQFRYVNHLNQSVIFGNANVLLNEHKVRDYEWKYDALYSKIINFRKEITTFKIPISVIDENKENVANDLFAIFERDVLAQMPGRLYCGDYYITGYIIGKSNKDFIYNKLITIELTFVTDEPFWKKENNFLFRIKNSLMTEEGLGYPYNYPYDFLSPINVQSFNNTNFADSDFIMKIYGYIESPSISIGGHEYRVNCIVDNNEILTINSKERTVKRTTRRGDIINEFANRDRANNVFAKIPPGTNRVVASADFNYDIVILEERSEPKWS